MASPLLIVDTDILIDVSRHVEQAIKTLDGYFESHVVAISTITQLELIWVVKIKENLKTWMSF